VQVCHCSQAQQHKTDGGKEDKYPCILNFGIVINVLTQSCRSTALRKKIVDLDVVVKRKSVFLPEIELSIQPVSDHVLVGL
jgi:hypothetical protein